MNALRQAMREALASDIAHSFFRSPAAIVAAIAAIVMVAAAFLAPLLATQNPFDLGALDLMDARNPPRWLDGGEPRFLLGTDNQGRDLYSAILYGTRISIGVSIASVVLALVIGVAAGLVAGYRGGLADTLIMRAADVQLTFPAILTALLLSGAARVVFGAAGAAGTEFWILVVAIGLSFWVQYARTVRASTLIEKSKDYVAAARLIGLSAPRIMATHVLPNILGPVLVIATINLALAIITEATLSFLGVGLPPSQPSLGTLVRTGNDFLFSGEWWIVFFPGLALAILALSVNMLGDWLRDGLESASAMSEALLSVRDLCVDFLTRHGPLRALDHLSFEISRGEVLGVVGESGAGKSLTGRAIIQLLDAPGKIVGGEIRFGDARIDNLPPAHMRKIRGRRIATIFQDPLTSLDPLQTIGAQLVETITTHLPLSRVAARDRALTLLGEVGIPSPAERIDAWPHQFSGGMRQRVVIALALAGEPDLLIADEPTTALDVSVQAGIIVLLRRLATGRGLSVMLVTHDMGVIAEAADRVAVMYAGRIVEIGAVADVIARPWHPYTQGLMAAIPSLVGAVHRLNHIPGAMPRLGRRPAGCAFSPRCPKVIERCRQASPPLETVGMRSASCFVEPVPTKLQANA